jgi:1-aminocyclopropane-1-carboxylate deaminase/D-cysteine desulfhydrase-like pyridoxal-dependent ACC family enzyme
LASFGSSCASLDLDPIHGKKRDSVNYDPKSILSPYSPLDLVRRKHFKASDHLVFWHTGGTPGLVAYRDVL